MKNLNNNVHTVSGSILKLAELKSQMNKEVNLFELKQKGITWTSINSLQKEIGKNLSELKQAWIEIQSDGSKCIMKVVSFASTGEVKIYPIQYLEPVTRR